MLERLTADWSDERKFWIVLTLSIAGLTLLGALFGWKLQFGALIVFTIVSFVFLWVRASWAYNVLNDNEPMVTWICSIYVNVVAWITYYFASGAHWFGDFMRENVFR